MRFAERTRRRRRSHRLRVRLSAGHQFVSSAQCITQLALALDTGPALLYGLSHGKWKSPAPARSRRFPLWRVPMPISLSTLSLVSSPVTLHEGQKILQRDDYSCRTLWSCKWISSFPGLAKARRIRAIWWLAAVRATSSRASAFMPVSMRPKRTCSGAESSCATPGSLTRLGRSPTPPKPSLPAVVCESGLPRASRGVRSGRARFASTSRNARREMFCHSERSEESAFRRRAQRTCTGTELNNALAPFHRICTPMHTSRNEDSCIITVIPVVPRIRASRSANA